MILKRFPVFVGTPEQRKFDSPDKAFEYINRHNGLTDVYDSLYNNGVIDKVVWDFDYDVNSEDQYSDWETLWSDVQKLTYELRKGGYKQMTVFSGNGVHKYLKTVECELSKPKKAIRKVQEKYQSSLGINTDEAVFGDVRRIFRVPNTYNPSAERFCIPLKPEDIEKDIDDIKSLADGQRFVDAIEGENEFNILKYDCKTNWQENPLDNKIEGNFSVGEGATLFETYPCITNLLENYDNIEKKGHGLGFRRRFLVILHLKETGHTIQETREILKDNLSEEEYLHCVHNEGQVEQIYKREDMLFPRCDSLMQEIPCIHNPKEGEKCPKKDSLYR